MIIGLFGPSAETWLNSIPRPIRVTAFRQGDAVNPSVHDLAVLAVYLMRLRGVQGTGDTLATMPVWDLFLNGKLHGTPLSVEEQRTVSLSIKRLCKTITERYKEAPPGAVIFDQVEDIWNTFVLGSQNDDPIISKALREKRFTDSIHWLHQSLPIVLIAGERDKVVGGAVIGKEPNVDPTIDRLVDVWLNCKQPDTAVVYAARPHLAEQHQYLTPAAAIKSAYILDILGFLSEPDLQEV